jgi:hypothetical protein
MSNPQQPLSDVLYWLSLEDTKPTAAIIDEYRVRFPGYAEEITEFALDLALDALVPETPTPDVKGIAGPPSSLVMQAISDFQNARYQVAHSKQDNVPFESSAEDAISIVNPFTSLDSDQFRALTLRIDANTVFVAKLRDRRIMPNTIPMGLTQIVAKELNVSTDVLIAHLSAKPAQAFSGVYYKAIDKPLIQIQETFDNAVRTSGLSAEQQERLLRL